MKKLKNIIILFVLCVFICPRTFYANTLIEDVSINIRIPLANKTKVSFVENAYDLSYDVPFEIEGVLKFYDHSDQLLQFDDHFNQNEDYYVEIHLKAQAGYEFDTSHAYINGRTVSLNIDPSDHSKATCLYEFKALEEELINLTYVGIDQSQILQVKAGEAHYFDSSLLLTPFNKALEAYEINGVYYLNEGAPYFYPSSDTTIKVIYKENELYISGIKIDDSNANDVFNDGSVYYDQDKACLRLKNASILTEEVSFPLETYNVGIYSRGPLKIILEGENIIEDQDIDWLLNVGIKVDDHLLIESIDGGSLKIQLHKNEEVDHLGMSSHSLKMDDVKMDLLIKSGIYGINDGLSIKNDLIMNHSNLHLKLQDGYLIHGLSAEKINIKDSRVDLELSGEAYSLYGIEALSSFESSANKIHIRSTTNTEIGQSALFTSSLLSSINDELIIDLKDDKGAALAFYSDDKILVQDLKKGSHIKVIGFKGHVFNASSILLDKGEYILEANTKMSDNEITVSLKEKLSLFYNEMMNDTDLKIWDLQESLSHHRYLKTDHIHEYQLSYDEKMHWDYCECGMIDHYASHFDDDGDDQCDICHYLMLKKDIIKNDYKVVNTGVK